jgi:hypothetical protein
VIDGAECGVRTPGALWRISTLRGSAVLMGRDGRGARVTLCGWGDTSLVRNGVVWRSLSKQGLLWSGERCGGAMWRGRTATLLACQAGSLFCIYDSLIEKCSTLSRPSVSSGVTCFSHLSVAPVTDVT